MVATYRGAHRVAARQGDRIRHGRAVFVEPTRPWRMRGEASAGQIALALGRSGDASVRDAALVEDADLVRGASALSARQPNGRIAAGGAVRVTCVDRRGCVYRGRRVPAGVQRGSPAVTTNEGEDEQCG